eukprot:6196310-Pleurochrysis_carterae.AAC.1
MKEADRRDALEESCEAKAKRVGSRAGNQSSSNRARRQTKQSTPGKGGRRGAPVSAFACVGFCVRLRVRVSACVRVRARSSAWACSRAHGCACARQQPRCSEHRA